MTTLCVAKIIVDGSRRRVYCKKFFARVVIAVVVAVMVVGCATTNNDSDEDPVVEEEVVENAQPSPQDGEQPVDGVTETDEIIVEDVQGVGEKTADEQRVPLPPAGSAPRPNGKQPVSDNGDFIVFYNKVSNPAYENYEQIFKQARLLENVAANLNRELALPANLTLSFTECGMVNAFYSPQERKVAMCYELVDLFRQLYVQSGGTAEDAAKGIAGAVYLTMYHEVGHALVDVLDLPITGAEEVVVDQLSTFILIEQGGERGEMLALNGARFYLLMARQNQQLDAKHPYWDVHATDEQRFFNFACWIYGSNPDKYSYLVDRALPKPRAVGCSDEYRRFVKGWRNALAPFIKSPS